MLYIYHRAGNEPTSWPASQCRLSSSSITLLADNVENRCYMLLSVLHAMGSLLTIFIWPSHDGDDGGFIKLIDPSHLISSSASRILHFLHCCFISSWCAKLSILSTNKHCCQAGIISARRLPVISTLRPERCTIRKSSHAHGISRPRSSNSRWLCGRYHSRKYSASFSI